MRVQAAAISALFVTGIACAQPLGLKGFHLGDEMKACPGGAAPAKIMLGMTMCSIAVESLAGQPVSEFLVGYNDERVVAITVSVQGGSTAADALRDALSEIYGPPTVSKNHISEYIWRRPLRKGISVSGNRYSGTTTVFVMDAEAHERIQKQAAKKNKGDL